MNRRYPVLALLAVLGLASALAGPASAQSVPGLDIADLVVLGTNSVALRTGVQVCTGDVAANIASPGPTLQGTAEMVLDRLATAGDPLTPGTCNPAGTSSRVIADSLVLRRSSVVAPGGEIVFNDLTDDGAVLVGVTQSQGPWTLPFINPLPAFQSVAPHPSAQDLVVTAAASPVTLPFAPTPAKVCAGDGVTACTTDADCLFLAPGNTTCVAKQPNFNFRDIFIDPGATVIFTAGNYNIRNILEGTGSGQCPDPCFSMRFDGEVNLRVLDKFKAGKDSYIGPHTAATSASDILIYVNGLNGATGGLGGLPQAALVGQSSDVRANFDVRNGKFQLDRDSTLEGSVIARDVEIQRGSVLRVNSAYTAPPDDPEDPGDPGALGEVVAQAQEVEVVSGTTKSILLRGDAPCDPTNAQNPAQPCDGLPTVADDVPLTFSIFTDVPSGEGSAVAPTLVQGSETPQRTATVTYDPQTFTGVTSFVFKVEGDVDKSGAIDQPNESSTATVTIEVQAAAPPVAPVAEDVSAAVESGSTAGVVFSLDANAGSSQGPPAGDPGRTTLTFSGASAGSFDPRDNGGSGRSGSRLRSSSLAAPAALGVGTGWERFTWWDEVGAGGPPQATCSGPGNMVAPALNQEGPFTFTLATGEEGCLSITDVLLTGDRFRVLNAGVELATTTLVPQGGPNVNDDPDAAFASSAYSHRQIPLPSGSYSITIETIPGNSLWCGRGYLRVDTVGSGKCDAEKPLLTYKILTVPDGSFGTLFTSAGQTVIAGTILPDSKLKFVPTATSGTNSQTTYQATNTKTGLVSNVATVNLGIVADVAFNNCMTSETFCDKGRGSSFSGGGSFAAGSEESASPASRRDPVRGPALSVEVVGPGSVATGPREWRDQLLPGVICGEGAKCGAKFVAGSEVKLMARPDGLARFAGWRGDCYGEEPIITVAVYSGTACTAIFETDEE